VRGGQTRHPGFGEEDFTKVCTGDEGLGAAKKNQEKEGGAIFIF
jgi:hypothetical protein